MFGWGLRKDKRGGEERGGEGRRGEEEFVCVNVDRGIIGEREEGGGVGSFLEYTTTQKTKGTKIERERGKGEPEVA